MSQTPATGAPTGNLVPSTQYVPLPVDRTPAELHPAAEEVTRLRAAWHTAVGRQYDADRLVQTAERDHLAAVRAAAAAGQDAAAVVDERPLRQHAAARAAEATNVAKDAVRAAWRVYVNGITAHRDDVRALLLPAAQSAQVEAVAAAESYRQARATMLAALSQYEWAGHIDRANSPSGANTEQGAPAASRTPTVAYIDSAGKTHEIAVTVLLAALEADSRALDRLTAAEERRAALAARAAGDTTAQQAAVPRGRLTVR